MSTKFTSPYTSSFKSGITNGYTCTQVVNSISKKTGKSVTAIFQSLTKAGYCKKQNFNGTWCYWPVNIKVKSNKTSAKNAQQTIKQLFVDWCLVSGATTPVTFTSKSKTASKFSTFCKGLWSTKTSTLSSSTPTFSSKSSISTVGNWTKTASTTKKRKTTKRRTTKRTTTNNWTRNYKFAAYANRTGSAKRLRKVA